LWARVTPSTRGDEGMRGADDPEREAKHPDMSG